MDVLTSDQRRRCMASVRGKDTQPEMIVRRAVHRLGYRYRLHSKDLPGKPDLVFPVWRKVIFVHGCFWHRHRCKKGRSLPQVNREFWEAKLAANVERDRKVRNTLRKQGWQSLIIWECQTCDLAKLAMRLSDFISASDPP